MRAGNLGVARKRKSSEQEERENTAYCVGLTVERVGVRPRVLTIE
jgi:hypothetical protein